MNKINSTSGARDSSFAEAQQPAAPFSVTGPYKLKSRKGKLHVLIPISWRIAWVKLRRWEFWPIPVVYFLPSFYFLYCCAKARSWFFFSAANPSMDNGGMLFESKWEIFKLIPEKYYPTTIAVRQGDAVDAIVKMMSRHEMNYPVVAKPDRGERGWGVKILRDVDDLLAYHEANGSDYLIQAYVDYPLELSIMYVHIPGQPHGRITSLTRKEMLAVTGDGSSTIAELIKADYRALVQYPSLAQMPGVHMGEVLPAGERRELVPYGNHCRGAAFYDERAEITPALEDAINHIASQIEGFNYGRFDLRCTSLDVLAAGRNFSILELNGGSAEPAHIYEAGFSFWEGQRTLMRHFRLLREVAVVYMKQGQGTIGWKDFIALFKARKAYRKRVRFT